MFKTFKTDIIKGKKIIFFFLTKGLGNGFAVLVPLLSAKILAPEIMGSFFLFKMLIFFMISLLIAPLAAPFNIESNKEYATSGKTNKTFTSLLVYLSSSLVLAFLIFLLWGQELMHFVGLDYVELRAILVLAFLGLVAYRFLPILFLGQNNKKMNAILELLFPLIHFIYIGVLFLLEVVTLKTVLLGYPLAGLIILIVSVFAVDYKKILPLHFSKQNFTDLWKFSSWLILATSASYLINWGDNIILKYYVSMADIGVYNLGYQFFKMGLMFHFFVAHFYTPYLTQRINKNQSISNYLNEKRKKVLLYVFIIFIAAEIAVGPLIKFFFDASYYEAINITRILLLGNFFLAVVSFYLPVFYVIKKYKLATVILVIQLLINIALDIIFVKYWGVIGAAIATTIAYLIYAIIIKALFEYKIKKTLDIPSEKSLEINN